MITLKDDGRGLDAERILSKARAAGLVPAEAKLSHQEIYSLIMEPGFSTTEKVTSTSGRGVGMDVVKRDIMALSGMISIDSEPGVSTSITLTLPLTLAIVEGLLTQIGDAFYVFPLLTVEECVERKKEDLKTDSLRGFVSLRDRRVPYIHLRNYFGIEGTSPEHQTIIISTIQGQNTGFSVDRVIGQHQTIIKNLGTVYHNIEGITGATILGDGTVALVLDLQGIIHNKY